MMLPTLYSKGKKDEIRLWQIRTHGADIITSHGVLGGKLQTSTKTAKGKNIGKKNETLPEAQAASEARSMWAKKKKKGYFETVDEAENTQVFLPMLASKYEDREGKVTWPCTGQPKLDGVRAMPHWGGSKVRILSRGGELYDIRHIAEQVEALLQPKQVIDGEIYIHGLSRQDINALVKKHRPEPTEEMPFCSTDLELWIYDTFFMDELDMPWNQRHPLLSDLRQGARYLNSIRVVNPTPVWGAEDVPKIHERYVRDGFEGLILREQHGIYELANRSNHLIKYKVFQDAEYRIIGYTEGTGKFVGCVIWICETPEGKEFSVVPKGTLKEKATWFKEGDKYVDQWLTVKFQSLSNDRIPEFPVGLGIRLPEDM